MVYTYTHVYIYTRTYACIMCIYCERTESITHTVTHSRAHAQTHSCKQDVRSFDRCFVTSSVRLLVRSFVCLFYLHFFPLCLVHVPNAHTLTCELNYMDRIRYCMYVCILKTLSFNDGVLYVLFYVNTYKICSKFRNPLNNVHFLSQATDLCVLYA